MYDYLKKRFKKIPRTTWILLGIILIGIFLRTYNFHNWLEIEGDQTRDAILVHNVLTGKSPWPLLGPKMDRTDVGSTPFHLGPVYYYFQIISAKIFGDSPDKMAYPDLLFSIFSIPLFYVFFKKYFSLNLSLALTGLHTISFFSIKYARFAWNPNSIPFFVLLFLLSINEFVTKKEKTGWRWPIFLGIALSVGAQLHALIMLIFFVIIFFVFVFSFFKKWKLWKKWSVVLLIFIIFNLTQIVNETQTNFSNSKILLNYFSRNETQNVKKDNPLQIFAMTVDRQIESNFYILSSIDLFGQSNNFIKLADSKNFFQKIKNPFFAFELLSAFLFSIFGYLLLGYYCKSEKDKNKKYFLRLIAIYLGLYFFVMLIGQSFSFRYFNCVFFAPFLFLGFFSNYLNTKFPKVSQKITILLFTLLFLSNTLALASAVKELSEKQKTGYNSNFLVQIEPLAQYLIDNLNGEKNIYLKSNDSIHLAILPIEYYMEKQNIKLIDKNSPTPENTAFFYLSDKIPQHDDYEKIGQIYVSKAQN